MGAGAEASGDSGGVFGQAGGQFFDGQFPVFVPAKLGAVDLVVQLGAHRDLAMIESGGNVGDLVEQPGLMVADRAIRGVDVLGVLGDRLSHGDWNDTVSVSEIACQGIQASDQGPDVGSWSGVQQVAKLVGATMGCERHGPDLLVIENTACQREWISSHVAWPSSGPGGKPK